MLKLKINLYDRSDRYTKKFPVIIRFGNIETSTPFPKIGEKTVNFQYDYSKAYEIESQGKVNTRFKYPYSENYIKSGDAGNQHLYAKLNRGQRFILSLINKNSIFHKHPKAIIGFTINILGFIPVWYVLLSPCPEYNSTSKEQTTHKQTEYNRAASDSLQSLQNADTLAKPDTPSTK